MRERGREGKRKGEEEPEQNAEFSTEGPEKCIEVKRHNHGCLRWCSTHSIRLTYKLMQYVYSTHKYIFEDNGCVLFPSLVLYV